MNIEHMDSNLKNPNTKIILIFATKVRHDKI